MMKETEKYLIERLNKLSEKRNDLTSKIEQTELQIGELEYKIRELTENIDEAFEIFSPRVKKNDYVKNEIGRLEKEKQKLKAIRDVDKEKEKIILEDITNIKGILENETVEDKTEKENCEIAVSDLLCDNEISEFLKNNTCNSGSDINQKIMGNSAEKVTKYTMESLAVEKERMIIGKAIEEKTIQAVSNLVYKCDVCSSLLEVDTIRARLEIEVMSKKLNDLYDDIKEITDDLKSGKSSSVAKNSNYDGGKTGGKISVKKLSRDNFTNGRL